MIWWRIAGVMVTVARSTSSRAGAARSVGPQARPAVPSQATATSACMQRRRPIIDVAARDRRVRQLLIISWHPDAIAAAWPRSSTIPRRIPVQAIELVEQHAADGED